MNTALTRGCARVSTAVVHPIESYWISYGPAAQTKELRDQMDDNFRDLIQWLLFGLVDFDFISESLLPGQCPDRTEECLNGTGVIRETPDGAALAVGNMSYHTVLVPDLRTIRSTTLSRLEALADAGGNVVFLGKAPALVDGIPDDRARRLAGRVKRVPFQKHAILQELEEERDVDIRRETGAVSYTHL